MSRVPVSSLLRKMFADNLLLQMKKDEKIWLILGDIGYKIFDEVRLQFPDRVLNVGAAEQSMIDVSIGLALNGKTAIAYTITPFLIYRPFESLRTYINHEKIPVKLVGAGRDKDYSHDGISHWSTDDKKVMKLFSNINSFWPKTQEDLDQIYPQFFDQVTPIYLNLCRK